MTGRPDIDVEFVFGEPAPADCARCQLPIRPVRVVDRGAVVYHGADGALCLDCAARFGGDSVYDRTGSLIRAVRQTGT